MIFRHLLNMRSHPTWVRGLKLPLLACYKAYFESHPTWVRGLKHIMTHYVVMMVSRTLRGCVD